MPADIAKRLSLPEAFASPVMVRIGWRNYFISPLTVADIADYYSLGGSDGELTMGSVRLLVWLSLRRLQKCTLASMRWRFFTRNRITKIFEAVQELNPSVFNPAPSDEGESREGYEALLKVMAEAFRFNHEQVGRLTLRQVEGYMKKCGPRAMKVFTDPEEARQYAEEQRRKQNGV